jgi:D-alanyl-D-alanine carboxypeptidase (penicillin-binding protein 5/6)
VLFEKNADERHPPASITKIMTMLLVMEAVDRGDIRLNDTVTVSARASQVGGSQAYLAEGEQFTVEDLLKAVAIHSANDACVSLAEFVSGDADAFVDSMNEKARALGMKNTTFHTPHGLPPDPGQEADMTTARDVTIMSRELSQAPDDPQVHGTTHDSMRGGKFARQHEQARGAGGRRRRQRRGFRRGGGSPGLAKRRGCAISVVMGAGEQRGRRLGAT